VVVVDAGVLEGVVELDDETGSVVVVVVTLLRVGTTEESG